MDFSGTRHSRRRFGRAADQASPILGFAPVVDIILQLICFYLFVAGSIQRYDDPAVRVPFLASPAAADEQPSELVINIRTDGSLTVNDRPMAWEALAAVVRAAQDQRHVVQVTVRVDRRQSFAALQRALDLCREARLPRIAIRTTRDHEP
jgi:biopolymer transport protein ExbD